MYKFIMTFEGYKQYRLAEKRRKNRNEKRKLGMITPEQGELKNNPDLMITPEC